jgi:hypothetical protein
VPLIERERVEPKSSVESHDAENTASQIEGRLAAVHGEGRLDFLYPVIHLVFERNDSKLVTRAPGSREIPSVGRNDDQRKTEQDNADSERHHLVSARRRCYRRGNGNGGKEERRTFVL